MTPVAPQVVPPGASRVVFGRDQPEYQELPAVIYTDGLVMTEWEPTAEELHRLMCGGLVRIFLHTFQQPVQPLTAEVTIPECGMQES